MQRALCHLRHKAVCEYFANPLPSLPSLMH